MARRRLPHFDVAVAVIRRRGRYLICQRRAGSHYANRWEFPGGKRRPGETWKACVHREAREELGVDVARLAWLMRISHRYPHKSVCLGVFRCAIRRGVPKPLSSNGLRWVSAEALARYPFPPANRRLIARIARAGSAML
ncbi:MAG: (deoxy)nucleoside triphosphate pyrophosphohydrolase [Candidatus Omnitrophica bacterium]|nr:(deoxy)nucleoside triphosphate pyrophosphohydrolase [Candidatus Omnitrophota bacterium]